MKFSQLFPSFKYEVARPLEKKLKRANELIQIFGSLAKDKACVSCSFGKDSMLVLWLCRQQFPEISVVFNNTGVAFPETIHFKDKMKEEWNLNLIETKAKQSFWELWDGRELPDGAKQKKRVSQDRCCHVLKENPFHKVVKEYGFTINFTGITVMESRQRMLRLCERGLYYYHKTHGITRIHPIAFWKPEEVFQFSRKNNIPLNPAYEKYDLNRIGCQPCTAHKHWRKELAKTNPRMYKFVQEQFFHQKLLEIDP